MRGLPNNDVEGTYEGIPFRGTLDRVRHRTMWHGREVVQYFVALHPPIRRNGSHILVEVYADTGCGLDPDTNLRRTDSELPDD